LATTTTTNTTNSRQASRSPVTLKIKFKSATIDQFIERYSVDISHGGIFIRTKDPLPVGTALRFEFQLKDASPLITGDGTVVWTREFDANRSGVAPGMGVRFDRLPNESQEVLEQILAHKASKLGKPDEDTDQSAAFLETPTRVARVDQVEAFGDVPTRVTPAHVLKGLQKGPPTGADEARRTIMGIAPIKKDEAAAAPRALPFHNDLDEFPDEAFEEATKVAALEALAKQTQDGDGSGVGPAPTSQSSDDDVTQQLATRPSNGAAAFAHGSGMTPATERGDDEPTDREQPVEPRAQEVEASESERPTREAIAAHQDDEGHEDDGDMTSGDDMAPAPAMAPPMAAAMPASEPRAARHSEADLERDGGSSLGWIAAAAVLLVLGGIGGFLLLRNKDKDKTADRPKAPATEKVAAPTPTPKPTPKPTPTPSEPPAVEGGVEAVVTSAPEGATAELVGETQSGATPMTFKGLEKGKTYKVRVSGAGLIAKEISFEAGGAAPPLVKLDAKPVVLRVTSDPPGSQIFVDGRRQPKLTPADIKLAKTTVAQGSVTVSVKRAGFDAADEAVSLQGMTEDGDMMVREVSVTLMKHAGPVAKPPVVKPPVVKPPADKPPADKPVATDKPADKPPADKPADKPPADNPPDKPPGGEPTPDWMKPQ
jgi:uncharacterized protein (TIGR02266 family)